MNAFRSTMMVVLTACSLACTTGRAKFPVTLPDGDTRAAVEGDTDMACHRTHSAGGWTQLVYQSTAWRDLAARADAREPEAWTQIADLVEWNRRRLTGSPCTAQMVDNLRHSAERLAVSPHSAAH